MIVRTSGTASHPGRGSVGWAWDRRDEHENAAISRETTRVDERMTFTLQ